MMVMSTITDSRLVPFPMAAWPAAVAAYGALAVPGGYPGRAHPLLSRLNHGTARRGGRLARPSRRRPAGESGLPLNQGLTLCVIVGGGRCRRCPCRERGREGSEGCDDSVSWKP